MVINISSIVLLSESGPDHAKTFHMVVEINGVTYEAGSGKSKLPFREDHFRYRRSTSTIISTPANEALLSRY